MRDAKRASVWWVRYEGTEAQMGAAVHCIEPDVCPWLDMPAKEQSEDSLPVGLAE